jgi:hypothetical protein
MFKLAPPVHRLRSLSLLDVQVERFLLMVFNPKDAQQNVLVSPQFALAWFIHTMARTMRGPSRPCKGKTNGANGISLAQIALVRDKIQFVADAVRVLCSFVKCQSKDGCSVRHGDDQETIKPIFKFNSLLLDNIL